MNRQSHEHPEPVLDEDVDGIAERLAADGFVVLRDVIPLAVVEAVHRAYEPLLAAARGTGDNRGPRRYSFQTPFAPPFSDPMLYANPAILAVLTRVLGDDLACACFGSGTADPGCDYQPVHRDEPADLYGEAPNLSLPSYAIIADVPLVDVGLDNGPMEIWPGGTHRLPAPKRLEQVAAGMSSTRVTMRRGSVLLRDIRAWHRGTPNRADAPRTLLGYGYSRPWFRYHTWEPMRIPATRWAALPDVERRLMRYCATA